MSLLREGQMIGGTCEVERFLGEGAFAEVYRVRHRFLGRQAMKVFKAVGMTMEEMERMLFEAILLSRLSHPNIIHVFDADVTETSLGTSGFFTMEYVAGGTLEQFWRSHGTQFVPAEATVEIMRQVCRGLAVAHAENPPIVHRDIKPQNVLVGYDTSGLNAKVCDFGLAKQVNPLTMLASARGTRCFKAPETILDWQNDSRAGDVWAIGSTMYLLLTDRLPYSELGDDGTLDPRRFERPLIPPSRLNVQVDGGLDEIVFRTLDRRPDCRYQTAAELLRDLNSWRPRLRSTKDRALSLGSSAISKTALGVHSPADQEAAPRMIRKALRLAKGARFADAADVMEEAFNEQPELRTRYEYQVKLWRRGVAM
ncbi:MAG: serine/threonine protein kinase [Acidobacteria bacterium RIFCSPLOWO2_02_FULL_68_18]|nr:MAG: serine/threonine protein kinase [Acidobacteria bacterium RIFCSPLOWO2_02_FULL_68_18]OFW50436.1 MAG: serine/threonine protein kinase [Acidobacteria bacterium RIFCSPLOWO2_12_FULL_68_19]